MKSNKPVFRSSNDRSQKSTAGRPFEPPSLIHDDARTRGLCRVRDTMADVWCFNVDAKFERNGIVSSNTLK